MNRGFVQIIVIFLLLLVIISLMGVSLLDIIGNKLVRDNFSFVWNLSNWFWNNYLYNPARIVWQIWVEFFWEPFTGAMNKIREGKSSVGEQKSY